MEQELTYRYRLYPNQTQAKEILRIAEAARQFYNSLLEEKERCYRETGDLKVKVAVQDLDKQAAEYRVEQCVLEYTASELERALRRFKKMRRTETLMYKEGAVFRSKYFPRYPLEEADLKGFPGEKMWGGPRKTFTLSPALLLWQDNAVMIPQVGWVRAKFHRYPPADARMKRCTVLSKSSGKFYLLVELLVPTTDKRPEQVPDKALGVVFCPGKLAVRSDAGLVEMRHTDEELERKIRKEYKTLQRRKPGSKRYMEQREKLARLYEKQAARRKDALHKASRDIVDTGKYIGVQVPDVKKMARFHKISQVEQIVHDEAWYAFYAMLRYKSIQSGMPSYPIPRTYPIWRICSACGTLFEREPRTSAWICPKCGVLCGKSGNAARNIQRYLEEEIRQWKEDSSGDC